MFETRDFEVLPNAIDVEQYSYNTNKRKEIRDKLGIHEGCFVIGHVGRFNKVKNHKFLIEILNELNVRSIDFMAVFAGHGELLENIKKIVYDKGLSPKVQFLGLVSNVPDYLQAMDIFILPSLYEGVPVSIVEAQASGLKCIVSDKVPMDCAITPLVKQLPLDANADKWADEILLEKEYERVDNRQKIIQAKYDINYNVEYLENYYLQEYDMNCKKMGRI